MDTDTVIASIGIIIAALTLIGSLIVGLVKILQILDRCSVAIDTLNGTMKAQWSRIDEQGIQLDEHGNRIVKLETRLDYHETKVHK